jgi:hypothetical protein
MGGMLPNEECEWLLKDGEGELKPESQFEGFDLTSYP